jgi:hypothetical protein
MAKVKEVAVKSEPEKIGDAVLPLELSRTIVLKGKDKKFVYHFRRLTQADWQAYFGGIVHQTLVRGGVRETVFEIESAQLELVEKTLKSVEGYGDTSILKDWKLALPLMHRLTVGVMLRDVGLSKTQAESTQLAELVEIRLDATWSANETGRLTLYSGLIHRFRQPSIEQLRRFNFESARVRVEGDSENGATVYPARQLVAMKIYDELIDQVEGYSVDGKPLGGADQIAREMDGAHKAEAALALFTQGDPVRVQ